MNSDLKTNITVNIHKNEKTKLGNFDISQFLFRIKTETPEKEITLLLENILNTKKNQK